MQFRLNLLACLLTLISLLHMRQTKVAQQLLSLHSDNGGISIQGSSLGANLDSSCKDSLFMGVVQSTFAKCINILFLYSLSRFSFSRLFRRCVFYEQVACDCTVAMCIQWKYLCKKKRPCNGQKSYLLFLREYHSKKPYTKPMFFLREENTKNRNQHVVVPNSTNKKQYKRKQYKRKQYNRKQKGKRNAKLQIKLLKCHTK